MNNSISKHKYRKPENFTLVLCFDVVQNSQSLQYFLLNEEEASVNLTQKGATAGTYNFVKNDTLKFEIRVTNLLDKKGTGKVSDEDIEIMDCTLVSIKPPTYPYLSLFNKFSAVQNIKRKSWSHHKDKVYPNLCVFRSSTILKVKCTEGQWEISGYLSVKLAKDLARLYYFDPEGSAGGGLGTEQ
ncbi:hypothetical protein N9W89_09990 [Hellea sp.]|nr:hypothetical protein [Hellea sp.]